MGKLTLRLQQFLNDQANMGLDEDGRPGRKTRAAVIDGFRNVSAPAANTEDIARVASSLGCTLRQVRAVASVESSGGGWDKKGLLKCLYERHYMWRRIRVKAPLLSSPRPGGYTTDADRDGINDSWEKLADSSMRWGAPIAFECASFGKFQIMGAHWKALGYASALDFVWQLSRTEAAHYDAFGRFIKANRLAGALRNVSSDPEACRAIAKGYNGRAYWKHNYHGRIAQAFTRLG